MMHFVALFTTVSVLVMFLASKQRRPNDKYGLTCSGLFALLAVVGTATLHGTAFFAASAFVMALLLCAHHLITSFNTTTTTGVPSGDETGGGDGILGPHHHYALFRREGAPYHETWITSALVAGTVSILKL